MATPTINWERLARAKVHPIQISVLELLAIDNGRAMSPNEMAYELQQPLGNVSYHVKELTTANLLELADTAQRRGALEHYYRLAPVGHGGCEHTDSVLRKLTPYGKEVTKLQPFGGKAQLRPKHFAKRKPEPISHTKEAASAAPEPEGER